MWLILKEIKNKIITNLSPNLWCQSLERYFANCFHLLWKAVWFEKNHLLFALLVLEVPWIRPPRTVHQNRRAQPHYLRQTKTRGSKTHELPRDHLGCEIAGLFKQLLNSAVDENNKTQRWTWFHFSTSIYHTSYLPL